MEKLEEIFKKEYEKYKLENQIKALIEANQVFREAIATSFTSETKIWKHLYTLYVYNIIDTLLILTIFLWLLFYIIGG